MSTVDVAAVLAGLKSFQRDTVDHVVDRFYGGDPAGSGRFLVADETGLGKSIVARGVIARAIEHLQTVDDVDRIDVVYVCSNADLARQNLRRLAVTDDEAIGMTTRLTLLARESHRLRRASRDGGKKVNLVSFTPGTSFREGGWRQGSADERALLTLLLDRTLADTESDRRTHRMLLQGTVSTWQRFDERYVSAMARDVRGEPDPVICDSFARAIHASGAEERFLRLRDDARGRRRLDPQLRQRAFDCTDELRNELAKAGVDTLQPDLIILDEFQRFRHLLADPETGGHAAELAHALFDHPAAKVLLLSATPYKPYTNRDDEEDHHRDFLQTVSFLAGDRPDVIDTVRDALRDYRTSLVAEGDPADAAQRVRDALLPLMSRWERPTVDDGDRLTTTWLEGGVPTVADLHDWVAIDRLGELSDSPVPLEYWKSIPHFTTFMDGYRTARRLREMLAADAGGEAADLLAAARGIDPGDIAAFAPIDLGNGLLRALAAQTLDRGWWRLLWLPPTMPYFEPAGAWADVVAADTTKHVLFSAWTGTPTSVAALLSYEADRRLAALGDVLTENTAEGRLRVRLRLNYAIDRTRDAPRASGMSTLALFWPHPALAERGDPLAAARRAGRMLRREDLEADLADLAADDDGTRPWPAFFSFPGALPEGLLTAPAADLFGAATDEPRDGDDEVAAGLALHLHTALERMTVPQRSQHAQLPLLAGHSPGNIAYRALRSVASSDASADALWRAAWTLSAGLRALFNRRETIALLAAQAPPERPYWLTVLDCCVDGNLQSVLDEYLFQLQSERAAGPLDDAGLAEVASVAAAAMGLRPVRYLGSAATRARQEIPFQARFALRYGGRRTGADGADEGAERQAEVRRAFNSPFAPFVLASTSVGQEGIDLHWWSHSVVHWNLPTNPVDFEQREGRVDRYAGHAIRKNVAAQHWPDVLRSPSPSPWEAAFAAAEAEVVDPRLGDFSPWWVYRGDARIRRVVATFPLSRDLARHTRLRQDLTLYRLTLGQPRQEDMVDLLRDRDLRSHPVALIDLRPPHRPRD